MKRAAGFANQAISTHPGDVLLGCFHPSQQNTFTGKLTRAMLDSVFVRARELAGAPHPALSPEGRG